MFKTCSFHDLRSPKDLDMPVFWVSDQVRHKLGCSATEDSKRFEISEKRIRGIVLSM